MLFFLALASASLVQAKSYTVTLFQPSVVGGTELKAGSYRLEVDGEKAVIKGAKQSAEAAVKVETTEQKFGATVVRYQNGDGKYRVTEIRLGGTSTKLVFN